MSEVPKDLAAEQALVVGMMQGSQMPNIDPDLFYDSRLREIWAAGQKAIEAGKEPTLAIVAQYCDSSIVNVSFISNTYTSIDIEIKNMEIYAKSVRGCAAQRKALTIADKMIKMVEYDPSNWSGPLEYAIEQSKAQLEILDGGAVPTKRLRIEQWVMEQEGVFQTRDMYPVLGFKSPKDQNTARKTMLRMVRDNIIEPDKKRGSGWYRKLDKSEVEIDFKNVEDQTIDLKLPFRLNSMFVARPKNIIVIAGEPDTGKTALAFQIAKLNQDGELPVYYFSSEMGPNEFRARLDQFEELEGDDFMAVDHWNMKAIERAEDFHDVIRPNAINIIDFLEIHEDFWAVGGLMKKIFDKLDQGICVVCIQKTNKESDYGLGGLRGLEKPRLYLSLKNTKNDWHTLKIVKCKSARKPEDMNPTGLELDFKLIRGCKFIPVNPSSNGMFWHRPNEEPEREDDNCFRSRL